MGGNDPTLDVLVLRVASQLQDAGHAAADSVDGRNMASAVEKAGAQKSGQLAVIERRQGTEDASLVAGSAFAGPGGLLEHGQCVAACCQALRRRAARGTGADDDNAPTCRSGNVRPCPRFVADQHLALGGESVRLAEFESGAGKIVAHAGRHRPCR